MNFLKFSSSFLLFLISFSTIFSQNILPENYKIERWKADDGLPQNSVNAISKDKAGFLWIGTYGGIVRFDGLKFDRIDAHGLTYERVISLHEDSKGRMWIGSENNGLFYIDREVVTHLKADGKGIQDILELSNGEIIVLIQTKGLAKVNGDSLIYLNDHQLEGVKIDQALVDNDDVVWLNTSEGVFRYKFLENSLELLTGSKLEEDGRSIGLATSGEVYFANQSGFYWIDTSAMTFTKFFDQEHRILSRQSYMNGSHLWYGGGENKLFLKKIENELPEIAIEGVSGGEVSSIFKAQEELWIGLNGGGLIKLTTLPVQSIDAKQGLKDEITLAIHQDFQQNLWIGTNSGNLYKRLPDGGIETWEKRKRGPQSDVWSITSDKEGRVWTGSFGEGVYEYDPTEGDAFQKMPIVDTISTVILALHYDTLNQRLLMGTDRGGVFQYQDEHWSTLIAENLNQARISQILQTAKNEYYVTTLGDGVKIIKDQELILLDTSNGFPFNTIRSIYKDSEEVVWYGTYGGGLIVQKDDKYVQITVENGLYDNLISSIQEDDKENLWMSCNKGVFKASKEQLLAIASGNKIQLFCQIYNKSHGMGDSETNGGFQPSSVKLNSKTLLFPTMKGVSVFQTDQVDQANEIEHLEIINLSYADTTITFYDGVTIPKEHRDFSIEFTAPHFTAPELIQFEYQLEGHSTTWKSSSTNRFVTYTSLAPGKYTFKLRARNSQGVLSKHIVSKHLIIEAYWYELFWIQLILTFFIAGSICFFFWRKLQITKKRNVQLEAKVTERTAELKEKSDQLARINTTKTNFYSSVSHELKTPLTLIKGPLSSIIENKKDSLDTSVLNDLELMSRNTDQLSELIVQLMDIARSDNQDFQLNKTRVEIGYLMDAIHQDYTSWINQKEIKFEYPKGEEFIGVTDKGLLQKAMANLISNALKFTPQGGRIKIETNVINENFHFKITDSGEGIHEKDLPYIFDRFYKSNNSTNTNTIGSGIGLAVVKEFIELMGGEISSENISNGGACFKFSIPFPKGEAMLQNEDQVTTERKPILSETLKHLPEDQEEWPLILLVDDNKDIREFIRKNLNTRYRIVEAENGAEGFEMAKEYLPDVVISDIMMPKVDGIELLQQLKSDQNTNYIPILLLTAKGSEITRIEGWKEGAEAYLEKPFNTKELLFRIEGILNNRKKLRSKILLEVGQTNEADNEIKSDFQLQFEALIQHKIPEPEFSFASILSEFSMSRSTFQRTVKEHYNCSPLSYLREKRLLLAKELLKTQEGSIAEVSYACGFNSVSYFNRVFKEKYGATPTEKMKR